MNLAEFYKSMGIDSRQIVFRFQDEKHVMNYLRKFLIDPEYARLTCSIQQGDFDSAYHAAHALMGLCQTLSLKPLQQSSNRLTLALRGNVQSDAVDALYKKVAADYQKTIQAIRGLLA